MADRVGQQLGHYRLTRLLGQGFFAEVYLGEHIHLGNKAAIKVLHANLENTQEIEQFRAEARQLIELIHPNIVRMLDFGMEEGTPYLVMDYAPNGTLRNRHRRGTQLSLATAVSYAQQVANGLWYAHQQKLIHRDIKPENLLLGRRDEVLISDFGIAVVAHTHYDAPLNVAGTVSYMAPEQLQGKPQRASDQYALGIMVYEWLTGAPPFVGSWMEIASQQTLALPTPLRAKNAAIPPAVEQVVMTAIAKDPKERFATIQAFASALRQAGKEVLGASIVIPNEPGSSSIGGSGTLPVDIAATIGASASRVPTPTPPQPQPSTPPPSVDEAATIGASTPSVPTPTVTPQLPSTPPPLVYDAATIVSSAPNIPIPTVPPQQSSAQPPYIYDAATIVSSAPNIPIPTVTPPPPVNPQLSGPPVLSRPTSTHPPMAPGAVSSPPIFNTRKPFTLLVACLLLVVLVGGTLGGLGLAGKGPLAFLGTRAPTTPTPTGPVVGKVTEFPLLHPHSGPSGIVTGPDGNLWFTELGADGFGDIGRITPAGAVKEFPVLSSSKELNDITAGADGNLWFNEFDVNRIGRITPAGVVTEFSVPTRNGNPAGVASGPDGNIWFTEEQGNKIGRITPAGAFQEFAVPTKQSKPFEITDGPDGNLWFTEFAANRIGRITPTGQIQEFPIPTANSGPDRIVSGPDGNLWFAEYNASQIGSITPSGHVTEFLISTRQSHPIGITSGPDNNLWFTERDSNRVGRITPSGRLTEFPLPTANSHPLDITTGPDRNLWVTESAGNQIARVISGQ